MKMTKTQSTSIFRGSHCPKNGRVSVVFILQIEAFPEIYQNIPQLLITGFHTN